DDEDDDDDDDEDDEDDDDDDDDDEEDDEEDEDDDDEDEESASFVVVEAITTYVEDYADIEHDGVEPATGDGVATGVEDERKLIPSVPIDAGAHLAVADD